MYGVYPAGVLLAQAGACSVTCKVWEYSYVVEQRLPSRLAVVKNVLGSSVTTWTKWQPPAAWPDSTSPSWNPTWAGATVLGPEAAGFTKVELYDLGLPREYDGYILHGVRWTFTWRATFASGVCDPGKPFTAVENDEPAVIDPDGTTTRLGSAVELTPKRVIYANKERVNWGMAAFSSTSIDAPYFRVVQLVDTTGGGNIDKIEEALQLSADASPAGLGLGVVGGTATRTALSYAAELLQLTGTGIPGKTLDFHSGAGGEVLTAPAGQNDILPRDPKLGCGRVSSIILVTDGNSNTGNNGNGDWRQPCLTCINPGDPGCPDPTQPSLYTCPGLDGVTFHSDTGKYDVPVAGSGKYTEFPAGAAAAAWDATALNTSGDSVRLNIRTGVIGISPEVGPCELNTTAYFGRTDAKAPGGDAGYTLNKVANPASDEPRPSDFFLPAGALSVKTGATTTTYTHLGYDDPNPGQTPGGSNVTENPYCAASLIGDQRYKGPCRADNCPSSPGGDGSFVPYHGNYAFFSSSANDLKDAIESILQGAGAGDYSTSGPSIASAASAGLLGLLSSGTYPGWMGHLYAYNLGGKYVCGTVDGVNKTCPSGVPCTIVSPALTGECPAPDTYEMIWDAGDVLHRGLAKPDGSRLGPNNGLARSIWTWSGASAPYTLVSIADNSAVTVAALDAVCKLEDPTCVITPAIVDFIRGYDGTQTDTLRTWQFGAVINSTPAITKAPEKWKYGQNHHDFETAYKDRNSLAWIGSSDGMMHAFDVRDGAEILAILPPNLLPLQANLAKSHYEAAHQANPIDLPTGQPGSPDGHLYGVASSPRYADVKFSDGYKTVLYMTEGPGGKVLYALDITHPFRGRTWVSGYNADGTPVTDTVTADSGFDAANPFTPLWSYKSTGLKETWSVPGVGLLSVSNDSAGLVMGSGYTPNPKDRPNPDPNPFNPNELAYMFMLDPVDGTRLSGADVPPIALTNAVSPLVRNEGFAAAAMWSTGSGQYLADNEANQAVQPDLHGHIWVSNKNGNNWSSPSDLLGGALAGEPLYYYAAVANYPTQDSPDFNVYAFSSGSFYEASSNVTGPGVGQTGAFLPSVFITVRNTGNGNVVTKRFPLAGLDTYTVVQDQKWQIVSGVLLSPSTQVSAAPILFMPKAKARKLALAVFLVFDPEKSCVGNSFIVQVYFDPAKLTSSVYDPDVTLPDEASAGAFDAGEGAASGFAIAGSQMMMGKSMVGNTGRAHFQPVPGVIIPGAGNTGGSIAWWVELQ